MFKLIDGKRRTHNVVPNLQLSIHVELNRNKEDKNPYSNNVISADADAVYEDVGKENSLPGYAELDQAKRGKDADTCTKTCTRSHGTGFAWSRHRVGSVCGHIYSHHFFYD